MENKEVWPHDLLAHRTHQMIPLSRRAFETQYPRFWTEICDIRGNRWELNQYQGRRGPYDQGAIVATRVDGDAADNRSFFVLSVPIVNSIIELRHTDFDIQALAQWEEQSDIQAELIDINQETWLAEVDSQLAQRFDS